MRVTAWLVVILFVGIRPSFWNPGPTGLLPAIRMCVTSGVSLIFSANCFRDSACMTHQSSQVMGLDSHNSRSGPRPVSLEKWIKSVICAMLSASCNVRAEKREQSLNRGGRERTDLQTPHSRLGYSKRVHRLARDGRSFVMDSVLCPIWLGAHAVHTRCVRLYQRRPPDSRADDCIHLDQLVVHVSIKL